MPKATRQRRDDESVILKSKLCSPTFRMLYYWGKMLGLNPLSLSKNNEFEFSYVALFYGCFLGSVYCYLACGAALERLKIRLPTETSISFIVDFMRIVWQCLNGSSTWFVFAIYQNRIKLIVMSFAKAERTSWMLGIPDDCDKRFRELANHVIVWNILSLAILICADVMWTRTVIYERSILRLFNLTTLAAFNMVLLFVWSLNLVKEKFHRLNDKVQRGNLEICQPDEGRLQSLMILKSRCNPKLQSDTIHMVLQLHRDLRIIIYRIEKYFALLILFCIANNFNYITLMTYRLYRYLRQPSLSGEVMAFDYLGVVVSTILYNVFMLIAISNVCASTTNEANNTSNMLHAMLNNCRTIGDTRIIEKYDLVFMDLLQNQVTMSLWGLFKLNNFLIYSIMSSAVNYVMIMLQL